MLSRVKTFLADGTNPNGRLFAGDLNAIQDAVAAALDYAQTIGTGVVAIGESGLQLLRYASGEARLTGALRTDGIFRGLGGVIAGAFTTTARNAISAPPYGLVILNTTTNRYEFNAGSSGSPDWEPLMPDPVLMDATLGSAAASIDSNSILSGNIPQTFKHLEVFVSAIISAADGTQDVRLVINNNTTVTDYFSQLSVGSGTTETNAEELGVSSSIVIGRVNGNYVRTPIKLSIPDYTAAVQHGVLGDFGAMTSAGSGGLIRGSTFGVTRQSAAVTRLKITRGDGGNFAAGTRMTIVGR